MQDGPLRITVKFAARLRYNADLYITRRIRTFYGEPYFQLAGNCNRCGNCCRSPVIPVRSFMFYLPLYQRLIVTWHKVINGFELLSAEKKSGLLVFRCTHWDTKTRLCDAYGSRPAMCRDYPVNLLYSPDPELFEACGYRAVLKNSARMLAALEKANLPADQLEKLKTRLHVRPDE